MELHISINKAPLISNYAALFELWGSIKLTHQNLISRHFFYTRQAFFKISHMSIMESNFPIDWAEFSEAGFSADVATERACETVETSNDCGKLSYQVATDMYGFMWDQIMTRTIPSSCQTINCLYSRSLDGTIIHKISCYKYNHQS